MLTKTLTRKEVLELIILSSEKSFPKDNDGYISAVFNEKGGIDLFYYRESEKN